MSGNVQIEEWLNLYDVEYRRDSVPVCDIDIQTSQKFQNRARNHSGEINISKPHRDEIALHLMEGGTIPPVVLGRYKKSLVILDGNHRVSAALEADVDMLDAYIIDDAPIDVLHSIAGNANARNGLHLTDSERNDLIVADAARFGQAVAARMWNKTQKNVGQIVRAYNGRLKLHSVGVDVSQPNDAKYEAANRIDDELLSIIGAKALKAVGGVELRDAAMSIEHASFSDKKKIAEDLRRNVEHRLATKDTPGARKRRTAATASKDSVRKALVKAAAALRENPSWRKDKSIAEALEALR